MNYAVLVILFMHVHPRGALTGRQLRVCNVNTILLNKFVNKLSDILNLAMLIVCSLLLQVRAQIQAAVDKLSWVERFYPSNIARGMAGGLDSMSDWLKSSKIKELSTSGKQTTAGGDSIPSQR